MKRIAQLFLVVCILLVSFCACNYQFDQETDKEMPSKWQTQMVETAIEKITETWKTQYEKDKLTTDPVVLITNTRIIKIDSETAVKEFQNVEYMVEFLLYTDYFGSSPYYSNVNIYDSVVFYRDDSVEVPYQNILNVYGNKVYRYRYDGIVQRVYDLGGYYDQEIKIKLDAKPTQTTTTSTTANASTSPSASKPTSTATKQNDQVLSQTIVTKTPAAVMTITDANNRELVHNFSPYIYKVRALYSQKRGYTLEITVTGVGKNVLSELTRNQIGNNVKIYLDGTLIMSPRVEDHITDGVVHMGYLSDEEQLMDLYRLVT